MSSPEARSLVSVVMPAYNYVGYVRAAVESVWAQTYPNLELIAVDDGSTDGTMDLLRELAAGSPVQMVVVAGEHRGVSAALNLALDHAQGELVSVLHADDAFLSEKVAVQVPQFDDPAVVLAHTEYQAMDADGEVIPGLDSSLDRPPATGEALRDILLMTRDVRSMTLMYRRSVLLGAGGYVAGLPGEDWQSILRLARAGQIAHAPERLVLRRVHQRSHSATMNRARGFSLDEIAPGILREVAPDDMDVDRLCALHSATVLRSAVAEGNFGKAWGGFGIAAREYPAGRRLLVQGVLSGLRSLVWMRLLLPILPPRAARAIRRWRVT